MRSRLIAVLGLVAVLLASGCAAAPDDLDGSPQIAAIDGVYRWATTADQVKGTPLEEALHDVPTSTTLIVVPNTFTLTLDDGTWSMVTTATSRHDGGSYTADGSNLVMEWTTPSTEGPWHMEYTYTVADDGSLVLSPKSGVDAPTELIFCGSPLIKIG